MSMLTVDELASYRADVTGVAADPPPSRSWRTRPSARLGTIDVVCNNAGAVGSVGPPLWSVPLYEMRHAFASTTGRTFTSHAPSCPGSSHRPIRPVARPAARWDRNLNDRPREQGLAARAGDPGDGRAALITLTDAGRAFLVGR
jgi:hypothetical protein